MKRNFFDSRSIAQSMTARQQATFLARYSRNATSCGSWDCEHGHYSCSDKQGGACLNEVLALVEERKERRKK